MIVSFYDLADSLPAKLQNFIFSERMSRTKSLLRAEGVLPIKRSVQWDHMHSNFAALLVSAFDEGGAFELSHTSAAYNSAAGLPSNTYTLLRLLEAKGFLEKQHGNQWSMTNALLPAVDRLTDLEVINA